MLINVLTPGGKPTRLRNGEGEVGVILTLKHIKKLKKKFQKKISKIFSKKKYKINFLFKNLHISIFLLNFASLGQSKY